MRRGRRSGLFTMVAVHSTVRGLALGGCRMWRYDDARAAVRDVLRLSGAMTLKAAAAGLPLGGGKGVIMVPSDQGVPAGEAREAVLRDFGDTVEALGGAYRTAEDVGTSADDMAVIARETRHVTGLAVEHGGSGDPSPWTALGVQEAIHVCCEHALGSRDLTGRTVAIAGLGSVGEPLARACAHAGAHLLVADVDKRRRAAAERLGARWVNPAEALEAQADVYAPCALGAVLDHDTARRAGARVIVGAANNQLADESVADVLADRGILWGPDFVANAGGIINISVELEPDGYAAQRARERVRGVGETMRLILSDAAARGVTPLAAAKALAERRLAEAAA
ncbi:MAG TPA: Glu/Leu/Phe/Val dehydrogenase dimerization domain-containing protein [Solirubrobacteraceae bacterium]|nr:Glu/Leu/Phe/Val dehydrogenase dimerization domain-containing protein [Solirubrobacteraceae bacterium]